METRDGPNLYLIGAPRSGTTFLHSAFANEPDVFAPPVKEPHFHLSSIWQLGGPEREAFTQPIQKFFAGQSKSAWGGMVTGEEDYRSLFAPGKSSKYRIEGTPNYFREADLLAQRLEDFVDEPVFAIAMVRDPVDRILSHYRLFRQQGWEHLDFEAAINAGPQRVAQGWAGTWDYIRYSQYSEPAAIWANRFGGRFRMVSYDDLSIAPAQVLKELGDWLGLNPEIALPADKFNSASRTDDIQSQDAEVLIQKTGRIDLQREREVVEQARMPNLHRPKVSVGMPVRNGARGIAAALASLQAQTYREMDIVVCDNASDDETVEIVRAIAQADPRVRLQEFTDRVDIKASYERALNSCQGDLFLFAPADDSWTPDFVAAAVGRMQGNPGAAVCCGAIELFDDNGNRRMSGGLKRVRGSRGRRWRRALLQMDAVRLYGLIRASALRGLFPDTAPQGWDHYSAAKLAWHGDVEILDMTAMHRHQTETRRYRDWMFEQESTFWGRVFFMRHVAQIFRDDPDIDTGNLAARMALAGFVLAHTNLALRGRGPALGFLRFWLTRVGKLLAAISRAAK